MEARADGREIALVVNDQNATYPIVIDPITASSEQALDGGTSRQTDARFGFAVAIDGDRAVVGAWRYDNGFTAAVDAGMVTKFTRTGSTWSYQGSSEGTQSNTVCGWSVAISGSRFLFGCPGANSQAGRAELRDFDSGLAKQLTSAVRPPMTGDQFGYSVAISGTKIVVGLPFRDLESGTNNGGAFIFLINSGGDPAYLNYITHAGAAADSQLGTSVALDGDTLIVGEPGAGPGLAQVYAFGDTGFLSYRATLQASDGGAGDNFGNSVDVSGNTAVVGAFGDDDKGTDAGAAYVFVRDANGAWSQQQKLKASGSRAGDHFSEHAVAIQFNTIVIGATAWDFIGDDNAGAAYIFTRNNTVWTEQSELDGASAYNFGIAVDISGDTVIIGARGADVESTPRTGAAYVYRLDCLPPHGTDTAYRVDRKFTSSQTVCPGSLVDFFVNARGGSAPISYQWRRNGVNIPGATANLYERPNFSASDAGSYDAVVSNACGSEISNAVALTIHTFSLNPTSQNFGVGGSTGIVNVTTPGSCAWTAVSNDPFITVTSGASGNGNGTVGFSVAANPNPGQRAGSITIAGLTFNVSQDGTNCSYSIAPTSKSLGASASTNSVNVTASAGCTWTATEQRSLFAQHQLRREWHRKRHRHLYDRGELGYSAAHRNSDYCRSNLHRYAGGCEPDADTHSYAGADCHAYTSAEPFRQHLDAVAG